MRKFLGKLTWCFFLTVGSASAYENPIEYDKLEKFKEIVRKYEAELKADPTNGRLAAALGDAYYSLKDYPAAIENYTLALKNDPDNVSLKISLANTYLANYDKDSSQKFFKEVLIQDSRNIEALMGLGRLEAMDLNFKKAEDYYKQALAINPSDPSLLYYYADLKIDLKQYAEAEKILEELKRANPKYTWIAKALERAKEGPFLDKIQKLEERHEYQAAIKQYQHELIEHKDSVDLYLGLARVYTLTQQPSHALKVLHKAANIDPTSNAIHIAFGKAYMAGGKFSQAKKYFLEVLDKSINNQEALSALGQLHLAIGDEETAEKYYKIALQEHPSSIVALSSYAKFKLLQNKPDEALKLYEEILKIQPDATFAKEAIEDIRFDAIITEMQKKPFSKHLNGLIDQAKERIQESPERVRYYIRLGNFYVQKREYQNAVNLYLQGLKVNPKSIELKLSLANAYLKRGDRPAAKILFEEILASSDGQAEAFAGLGKIEEIEGKEKEAKIFYERALIKDPSNLSALNYLANLLNKEKKFDEERAVLEKIERLDPSAKWVKQAIIDSKHGRLLNLIKEKIESKDVEGAMALYEQLLLEEPEVADYYFRAASYYHLEKKYERAAEKFIEGLKIDPKNADAHAALGFVYLSLKNQVLAKRGFKKALELDPKNGDALAGMASIFTLRKKFPLAEKYMNAALENAPNNDAVLSSLGNLRMDQKRYPEAASAYKKLLMQKPHEKWIQFLYENALNGAELDQIDALVKGKNFEQAAISYAALIGKYPENALYYSGLGQMYMAMKEYAKATEVYLDGLKTNPEEDELLTSLGYSYLFVKNWSMARPPLEKVLQLSPKNAEALAGLGRVYFEEQQPEWAETLYLRALEYQPKNQSALNFYAMLLMKQKRFREAEEIITRLQFELPSEIWVARMLKDAEDGPIFEIAKQFANEENFEAAAALYSELVDSSPDDPARYEPLGTMYVNLEDYCTAICIYEQGLEVDPEAFYLWRSIAFVYILLEKYEEALCILYSILEEHPEDAETIAGIGRVEALAGCWDVAEDYYIEALVIAPENTTALAFYADLKKAQGNYCFALNLYEQLLDIDEGPKWVRRGYQEMLNNTMPTLTILGGYHQEKEWDSSVHRNSARYLVQGAGALVTYPICCDLTLWGKMYDEYFELKDLLTRKVIYSLDVERAHVGARRILSPNYFMDMQLGISNYSRYRHGTSDVSQSTILEPGLRVTYQQPQEKASLAFWSDSTIVARNFQKNVSKLVGRYYFNAAYEKRVMRRGWLGFDGNFSAYNDYVDNTSAHVLGWFQWRPEVYTNNILFRYHIRLGSFRKNIPDYYTYKQQWVNYFQVTFEKYWRVCWADSFYTSLSLGHGFQNTYTRFAQFIVLAPTPNNKLRWDNRQYNIAILKGVYKWNQLQLSLILDYYRDTEKYTMGSILGELTWRF